MAELLIKTKAGANYRSGDIICAFNDRRIKHIHTDLVCHERHAHNRQFKELTKNALLPIGSVTRDYYRTISEFEFERVSKYQVIKRRLSDNEEILIRSNKPFEDFTGKIQHMDVELFVERRRKTLAEPNARGKPIFGVPGKEIWYGGRAKSDDLTLDSVWDQIEQKTTHNRNDEKFKLLPRGNQEIKSHLLLKVDNFNDKMASALVASLTDENGKIFEKRSNTVEWQILPYIDKLLRGQLTDGVLPVDIRKLWIYIRDEIVETKGVGLMIDYKQLKSEIENDPLLRDYANMTDAEVADSLNNVEDRNVVVQIPSTELLAWAAGGADDSGGVLARFERIEKAAAGEAPFDALPGSVRGIAKAAEVMIKRDSTSLDLNKADRQQMLDALEAGGVITTAEKSELQSISQKTVSRAEELGFDQIFPSHVAYVRNPDNPV